MIYPLLKLSVRLALLLFCRKISIRNKARFAGRGPLLVVANHPNSFLDAIVIGAFFSRPVHFLARGDAFQKPWHNRLLRFLNMIPVYRLSEGKDNLPLNEFAFRRSREILAANGIVLIFIEGICVHSHLLQPFKKGAARIAFESRHLDNFRILPIGIAYDSFVKFGKQINIIAGNFSTPSILMPYPDQALSYRFFNKQLREEIIQCIEVPVKQAETKRYTSLFRMLSRILHAPFYIPLSRFLRKKTAGTVFYDSVLFGSLLLLYPLYLVILYCLFALIISPIIALCVVLALPLLARIAVRYGR